MVLCAAPSSKLGSLRSTFDGRRKKEKLGWCRSMVYVFTRYVTVEG